MTEPQSDGPLPDFDALWNHGNPAGTEQEFLKLLPAAEASGKERYHLELLTQVARTQGLQRKFDEAHRTLDRVEAALREELVVPRIRALLERGRVWNSSGHAEAARPLFLQAWQIASAVGEDFYAVDAAHMLGIIEPSPASLEWSLKALEMAEASAQPRAKKWLGALYNNIGWSYHDSGRYEKALEIFEKALRWREEHGDAKTIRIARWAVGRALRSLNQVEQAIELQSGLAAELERLGLKDGYVEEELAEGLLALGRPQEAAPHFRRAHEELAQDAWLAEQEPQRIERLRKLAQG
jgi:tetratricopeptide (TPR) repeat protein